MKNKLQLTSNDIIEISVKTLLSAIPIGGELINNVWDSIKSNCAQKRLDDWQKNIEERLSNVDKTLEEIGNNENFATALFHATEMAIKTAENEKRVYLANAVVNSISCDLEESIMMMFFDMIGKYTIMHINILIYFQNPQRFISNSNLMMGSPKNFLYQVYPQFKENDKLVDKIIRELYADGLMNTDDLNSMVSANGMLSPRITELGEDFITFICNS